MHHCRLFYRLASLRSWWMPTSPSRTSWFCRRTTPKWQKSKKSWRWGTWIKSMWPPSAKAKVTVTSLLCNENVQFSCIAAQEAQDPCWGNTCHDPFTFALTRCLMHHLVFQGASGATSSYPQSALCQVTRLRRNQTELSCRNIWASWVTPIKSTWPSPGPRRGCASLVSPFRSVSQLSSLLFLTRLPFHRKPEAAPPQQDLEKPSQTLQCEAGANRRRKHCRLRSQIAELRECSVAPREDTWLDLLSCQQQDFEYLKIYIFWFLKCDSIALLLVQMYMHFYTLLNFWTHKCCQKHLSLYLVRSVVYQIMSWKLCF